MRMQKIGLAAALAWLSLQGLAAHAEDLTIWSPYVAADADRAAAFGEIIAGFMEENPDITVIHEAFNFEEHNTSVKLAVQGGTGPDILISQTGADGQDRYFRNGLLVDLAPVAVERGWTERFEPWVLAYPNLGYDQSTDWDGPKLAVIPVTVNLLGIYFNRDMFNELGLTKPRSWDEFQNVIETLKANGITPFAFGNLEQFQFLHMAWAAMHASVAADRIKDWYYMRDPSVKLTDEDFVRGLAWLQSLATDGYVNPDFDAVSRNDVYNLLYSGKFGMTVIGSWALQTFTNDAPFDVGFFTIPMMDAAAPRGIVGDMGWGLAVMESSDHKDAAFRFIDYVTSQAGGRAWYENGLMPAMKVDTTGLKSSPLQVEFFYDGPRA